LVPDLSISSCFVGLGELGSRTLGAQDMPPAAIAAPFEASELGRRYAHTAIEPAPKPLTGHCLCGRVSYTADAAPIAQVACHCTECQRQTSSPFSVIVGIPLDALEVQGETLASFTTIADDRGQETERWFCSACGSPIYSISPAAPDFAFIKAGSLDDASWLQPSVEVWTSSAQPWAPSFEGAMRFERSPG
jgi:hypothetical protein